MAIDDTSSFIIGVNADMSKIRNTNGNYWEPVGDNIQLAIDDLANTGGYGAVFVGSETTIYEPIQLKSNVLLDFLNNRCNIGANCDFVQVKACRFATVQNVMPWLLRGISNTAAMLHLIIPDGGGWADRLEFNTFRNIQMKNDTLQHDQYTGIHFECRTSRTLRQTFDNIRMWEPKDGILMETPGPNGWVNGCNFNNIYIDGFQTMVNFDGCGIGNKDCNYNVFNDIKGQTRTWSQYGFKNINGDGNSFGDGCLVWDWHSTSAPYDWIVAPSAGNTRICAQHITNILDQGSGTTYCGQSQ